MENIVRGGNRAIMQHPETLPKNILFIVQLFDTYFILLFVVYFFLI